MTGDKQPTNQVAALWRRLSQLSDASLRINESLDFSTVLQGVIDSARTLTGARYGGMLLYDDDGWIADYVSSGVTADQAHRFWTMPGGMTLQRHIETIDGPLRLGDFHSHAKEHGLPELHLPFPTNPVLRYLSASIGTPDERLGVIYLVDRDPQPAPGDEPPEFTQDDLEILTMLASQAALVISNARRHRHEKRARTDLETLVNTVPVGVLVVDAETRDFRSVNREALRIVGDLFRDGGSVQELLEQATFRSPDGEKIPPDALPHERALRTGETALAEEYVIEAPDGRTVTALVNAKPILTEQGGVESAVVTLQDMAPLADLDRLRAEFLGMVGHELRTPLTSIKGSAATLLEAKSSLDAAEVSQYHRIINEQADYMRGLIGDLIDIVRIETGTLSVSPHPAEIAELVDGARNTFLSAGGRDNIRISLAPDLPAIMADRHRIMEVITNLLSNAARNSHETSAIRVAAVLEGVHVAISVADDGRGVPAERLPHVFEKFSTAHRQDRNRDLGLGLAICKGIVEAHGGRIWAESEGVGLGSRFTFTVPAAEHGPADEILRTASTAGSTDAIRVLAVDDDPRTLRLIRDALLSADCEPTVTGDPDQVAALMTETAPHVVLLDLMLPGVDGIELMNNIVAERDTPIIFLSAYDQADLIAKAFDMGAVDYIVKPFSPTELAARVRAALRKQAQHSARYTTGDLVIDHAARTVSVAGEIIDLTPTEFRLLTELSTNAGTALTHDQLLHRVWGTAPASDARPMRTVIKNLRRKLGDEATRSRYIITVPHIGYRMPIPESH